MLFNTVVPILSILCFASAANVKSQDRIVGGENTNIQEVPYQCSLAEDGSHVCGCSIISPNLILTAAHCLEDVDPANHNLEVRAGSNKHDADGVVRKVKNFMVNPLYNLESMDYDTAVLRVVSDFQFSNKIKAIELDEAAPKDGDKAVISGWGMMEDNGKGLSPLIKKADVTVMTQATCTKSTSYGNNIMGSMFCARGEGTDACQGDSGGPIVNAARNKLIGVISFGFVCGNPKQPGIYSNISKSLKFIDRAKKSL